MLDNDEDKLDWLEKQIRKSYTGVSFDWIPSVEDEKSGYRYMHHHYISKPYKTLRIAIERSAYDLRP